MSAILARGALFILLLLTGLVAAARFLPYPEHPLQRLVTPPRGCPAPCWQGIRPDQTRYQDAIDLLERNPHIVNIDTRQTVYALSSKYIWYIYWTWQDESGAVVKGSLAVQAGKIRSIRIYKSIPFGLLWALLGEPEQGTFVGTLVYHDRQPMTMPLYHVAGYPLSGITVRTDSSCGRFWWQPSMFTVSVLVVNTDVYDLTSYRRYACKGWAI